LKVQTSKTDSNFFLSGPFHFTVHSNAANERQKAVKTINQKITTLFFIFNCPVDLQRVLIPLKPEKNALFRRMPPLPPPNERTSQASPICPSDNSIMTMGSNEHCRKNPDKEKLKYAEKNLSPCNSVHNKPLTDCPGPPRNKPATSHLNHSTALSKV
jgi:hypothetical protein